MEYQKLINFLGNKTPNQPTKIRTKNWVEIDDDARGTVFGSVKLTKNVDLDKYKYSSYSRKFDYRSEFSFTDKSMGKNLIIFGADISSPVHIDNKNKDILIFVEGTTQGLDDTTLLVEAKYPINFTQPRKRFVLSLHYNGSTSLFFVNATKILQSKRLRGKILYTVFR